MALLATFVPVCDAIARLLWPRAEVVLHDIVRDRIVHIANPFSARKAGDASLIGELPDQALTGNVVGPYPKRNFDGRRLKAVMSVIRDGAGAPAGLLCVNLDIEAFSGALEQIEQLIAIVQPTPRPAALFGADWREEVNTQIGEFLVERATSLERLTPEITDALLLRLDNRGTFAIRTAVPYVAKVLGLSRATIYARLAAARQRRGDGAER